MLFKKIFYIKSVVCGKIERLGYLPFIYYEEMLPVTESLWLWKP